MRERVSACLLGGLALLAACSEPERPPEPEPLLPPRLANPPPAKPLQPPVQHFVVLESTADVARLTPRGDDDPTQVMGLDRAALEALLGPPGFRREDADVEVWQYRDGDCLLDVYLYSDGLAAPYRVSYFELRGVAPGERRACFRGLLAAKVGG